MKSRGLINLGNICLYLRKLLARLVQLPLAKIKNKTWDDYMTAICYPTYEGSVNILSTNVSLSKNAMSSEDSPVPTKSIGIPNC